ncbi:HlyD family efflux transporter periplasmic adaptor subunit [Rouxiella chamberiensis]|jgi:multidrug resistance efflux pump|nr:HlyD family efflux transporter periplasmic adaptor subunit [Rouxiella chamberiensis]
MNFLMEELHGMVANIGKERPNQKIKKRMLCVIVIIVPYFICCLGRDFSLRKMPSTSDAYITGNPVTLSSEINGRVAVVIQTNSDRVRKGDILLHMDNSGEILRYKKAEETLLETEKETRERYIADGQNNAHILNAQMTYQQALIDYHRRLQSKGPAAISKDDLQQALRNVNNSKASLDAAILQYRRNLRVLRETDMARQKLILQAREALQKAGEALDRTAIRSPVTGYVAQRNVHTGLTVIPGQTLLTIVPADQMWINANFTVAQLSGVLVGQKAAIVTEMYGNNVVFDGQVEGWDDDADTAIPPLNSAGKWIADVQKIPVRISINPMQMSQYPLRIGISSKVKLLDGHSRNALFAMVRKGINVLRAFRRYGD